MPLKNIKNKKKIGNFKFTQLRLKARAIMGHLVMALAKSYSRIWGGGGVRNGEFSLVEGTKLQLN